jgi:hypothetical protein
MSAEVLTFSLFSGIIGVGGDSMKFYTKEELKEMKEKLRPIGDPFDTDNEFYMSEDNHMFRLISKMDGTSSKKPQFRPAREFLREFGRA